MSKSDDAIDAMDEQGRAQGPAPDGNGFGGGPDDGPPDGASPENFAPDGLAPDGLAPDGLAPRAPRPLVERLGMAAIAVVLAAVFAVMAAAAFGGGEPFLGVMAGAGSLMTLWVGGLTLRRG